MRNLSVMVAGLPGNMSTFVAGGIIEQEDMILADVGLSHSRQRSILVRANQQDDSKSQDVSLIPEVRHKGAILSTKPDIIVDFASGSSVKNCKMYCELGIPFVMGSTGGDLIAMKSLVEQSNISAVIAPNMASPIVVIQSMLEYAAQNFPGALDGYSLKITESHQAGKEGVSGTAMAFEKLWNEIGAVSDEDGILSVRNRLFQKRIFEIREEHLDGHGYHEHALDSPNRDVHLALVHNIDGRNVYVDGTIQAIRFMAYKLGVKGKVFSMVDVLKEKNK